MTQGAPGSPAAPGRAASQPAGPALLALVAAIGLLTPQVALAAPSASRAAAGEVKRSGSSDDTARLLLRRAIDLYVVGRYHQAVALLRPLVESRVLGDAADQQEALRIYGTALFLTGARVGAERAFRHLLRLDPRARLDRSFVRPEVVAFFETVRRHLGHELDRVARHGAPRGSAVANLLVPLGQFKNGQRTKGYVLLGTELTLAASSVASAALLYSWRTSTGEFPGHEQAASSLRVVNVASVAALVALFAYGIIDGLYYYYRGPKPALSDEPAQATLSDRLQSGFRF